MSTIEKRRHVRIDSFNLSYICVDEKGEVVNQGMGRTLNVSESGILLETYFLIESGQLLELTIALDDKLIDIKGKVVHHRRGKGRSFEAGIEFADLTEEMLNDIKIYIEMFQNRENSDD
jgi:hypothetical protein